MKAGYKQSLITLAMVVLVIPHVALAAWWNPFTWNTLNIDSAPNAQIERSQNAAVARSINSTWWNPFTWKSSGFDKTLKTQVGQVQSTTTTTSKTKVVVPATAKIAPATKKITAPTGKKSTPALSPTNVSPTTEFRVVSIFGETDTNLSVDICHLDMGTVVVNVEKSTNPIILSLNSYEPVNWDIRKADSNPKIDKIILGGYYPQSVTGVSNVPIQIISLYDWNQYYKSNPPAKETTLFYDARKGIKSTLYQWAGHPSCTTSAAVPINQRRYFIKNSYAPTSASEGYGTSGAYFPGEAKGTPAYDALVWELKTITGLDPTTVDVMYTGSVFTLKSTNVGKTTYPPGNYNGSIKTQDGRTRTYFVHVPTGYDAKKSYPLVLALHGGGGDGATQESTIGMSNLSNTKGFLVAYADAAEFGVLDTSWNAGACCAGASASKIDDVSFIRQLVTAIKSEYSVNSAKVFVTGMSNGAMLTNRLACEATDIFAGAAPVSGTIQIPTCSPSRPIPILMIHGTNDDRVPYNGGKGTGLGTRNNVFLPVSKALSDWAARNGCSGEPTTTPVPPLVNDGITIDKINYRKCAAATLLYRVNGGTHSWPGGSQGSENAPIPTQAFNASQTIWDFFSSVVPGIGGQVPFIASNLF